MCGIGARDRVVSFDVLEDLEPQRVEIGTQNTFVHFHPARDPRRNTCAGALLAIAARRGSWNEEDVGRRRRSSRHGHSGSPRRGGSVLPAPGAPPANIWSAVVGTAAMPVDGPAWNGHDGRNKRRSRRAKTVTPAQAHERTLMLRFLPVHATPDGLLREIQAFLPYIDFYYLPTNFETRHNLGYAFLNFVDRQAAQRFQEFWNASDFPEAPGSVTDARVQGFEANVERFRSSSVMAVLTEDLKPRIFWRGVQQAFPNADGLLPPVGPRFRPTGGDDASSGNRSRGNSEELVPSFLRPHSVSDASAEDFPSLPLR